jgi:hypothetical protein
MWTEHLRFLPEGFHVVNGSKNYAHSMNSNDMMVLGMKTDRKKSASTVSGQFSIQGKIGCELVV